MNQSQWIHIQIPLIILDLLYNKFCAGRFLYDCQGTSLSLYSSGWCGIREISTILNNDMRIKYILPHQFTCYVHPGFQTYIPMILPYVAYPWVAGPRHQGMTEADLRKKLAQDEFKASKVETNCALNVATFVFVALFFRVLQSINQRFKWAGSSVVNHIEKGAGSIQSILGRTTSSSPWCTKGKYAMNLVMQSW